VRAQRPIKIIPISLAALVFPDAPFKPLPLGKDPTSDLHQFGRNFSVARNCRTFASLKLYPTPE